MFEYPRSQQEDCVDEGENQSDRFPDQIPDTVLVCLGSTCDSLQILVLDFSFPFIPPIKSGMFKDFFLSCICGFKL